MIQRGKRVRTADKLHRARRGGRSRWRGFIATLALLLVLTPTVWPPDAQAQPAVRFMGMHGKKANLRIDRKPVLLAIGEVRNGVELLSVSRKSAVVRTREGSFRVEKGARPVALADAVTIERSRGMFYVEGFVNGKRTPFVVDTGASHVVLSGKEARRLRLRYTTHEPVRVYTASGKDLAYAVTLDSVSIGGIVLSKVPALITRGNAPRVSLLGMSFLGELRVRQDGRTMQLERQ